MTKTKRYVIKIPPGETLGTVLVGLCEQGRRELEKREHGKPLPGGPCKECGGLTTQNREHQPECPYSVEAPWDPPTKKHDARKCEDCQNGRPACRTQIALRQKKRDRALGPFVTGSHAYGIPGVDSDIDLVVHVTNLDYKKLSKLADSRDGDSDDPEHDNYLKAGGSSLRFGKLNLIAIQSAKLARVWFDATEALKKKAPVTRKYACTFMQKAREKAGYGDN